MAFRSCGMILRSVNRLGLVLHIYRERSRKRGVSAAPKLFPHIVCSVFARFHEFQSS
jgi:hypothetical protein